jgi:hypothetical protein
MPGVRASNERPGRTGAQRLAAAVLAVLLAFRAEASDFFGSSEGLQVWPELDVFVGAGDAFRIIGKLEPTWIPSLGNYSAGASIYGNWLVSPFMPTLTSPEIAKRRRLDVRVGLSWYPTVVAGNAGWANLLQAEAEATGRTTIPGEVLATLRNRVEARWQLDEPTSFAWRLRIRPQIEREFGLSAQPVSSLTPFANVEFIWSTSDDMWDQFRMQAGLQLGVEWFGKGQVIEVNGAIVTYLQPARSHAPVIGVVWYQYF